MSRRHAVLAVGLGISLSLAAPAPAPAAVATLPAPAAGSIITGWTGESPTAVGVGIERGGEVTAAFTSTNPDGAAV